MELIYTDRLHMPQGILRGFTLDMAYGSDENSFEMTVPMDSRLPTGALIYQYGTERGGVIDSESYDSTGDAPVLVYSGRTWHGILENSVVKPPAGQAYLVLSGDVNTVISQLIVRQGLADVFSARVGSSGLWLTSFQIPRYVTLYDALLRIARNFGKRLSIEKANEKAVISLAEIEYYTGGVGGSGTRLVIENNDRQTNHLVLLGKGELTERLVRDVYVDRNGYLSTEQEFFGIDEICEVYELSSEDDPGKLINDGAKKLRDKQNPSKVVISVPEGTTLAVGDIITGVAVEFGISAEAEIVKQIVNVNVLGNESIECMVGEPSSEKEHY